MTVPPGTPVLGSGARGPGRWGWGGAAGPTRCTRRSCGWPGSRSRRRGPVRIAGVALVHNLAQLLGAHAQQPQPSVPPLTPAAARRRAGRALARGAAVLAGGGLRREAAVSRRTPLGAAWPFPPPRVPPRRRPLRGSGAYPAAEGEQEHEGAADRAQAGG